MINIRTGVRYLCAALLITVAARAESVVYIFAGTDNSGAFPEAEAFRLVVPDFIETPPDGVGVDFTCAQLESSTNCSSPGVEFSDQSAAGAFSAQLQFDSPIVGSIYAFPVGAFTTPGTYTSEEAGNDIVGVLTVETTPEPASIVLTFGAGLLFLSIRLKRSRRTFRRPQLRS